MLTNERIVALREDADMTQKEFAAKIGINRSVVNRIEKGTRPIREDELRRIAGVFGVTTDYLLGIVADPRLTRLASGVAIDKAATEAALSSLARDPHNLTYTVTADGTTATVTVGDGGAANCGQVTDPHNISTPAPDEGALASCGQVTAPDSVSVPGINAANYADSGQINHISTALSPAAHNPATDCPDSGISGTPSGNAASSDERANSSKVSPKLDPSLDPSPAPKPAPRLASHAPDGSKSVPSQSQDGSKSVQSEAGNDREKVTPLPSAPALTPEEQALLDNYRALTARDKTTAATLLSNLAAPQIEEEKIS